MFATLPPSPGDKINWHWNLIMATVTFKGASGKSYDFIAYSSNSSFGNYGAVYIFTKQYYDNQGKNWYQTLYIGKTSELGDRISGHEKWDCVNENGVNSICVHTESSATKRTEIETDLLNHYSTPCNETN